MLEEVVEKQSEELKKFKQASKSTNKENVRTVHALLNNVNRPQYMYVPYLSVPFSQSISANRASVGQYLQNTGPSFEEQFGISGTFQGPVGGTFQDPVENRRRLYHGVEVLVSIEAWVSSFVRSAVDSLSTCL